MGVIVCKLGGSLLHLPDLAKRLQDVLSRLNARPLLIVGGGAAADLVRAWDELHGLGEERAHHLALQAMALNERLICNLMPRAQGVDNRDEASEIWQAGRVPVLRASEFLAAEESEACEPLPHTWDVTSDAIAAWVAIRWPADELLLLKSGDPPDVSVSEWSRLGAVDQHFAHLAPKLPCVSWVNLRDAETEMQ